MKKSTLLKTGYFINNVYLSKYIELLNNKNTNKSIKFKTSIHHIIPVAYYKLENLSINNTSDNLVILYNSDHVLAHYYLVHCTKGELNTKMLFAFNYMIQEPDKYKIPKDISNIMSKDLDKIISKARKHIAEINTGKIRLESSKQKATETLKMHYGVNSVSQLPGVGDKISKSKKGKNTMTDYQRQVIIESNKRHNCGTIRNESTKQKISNSLKGHTVSAETRAKISKSLKAKRKIYEEVDNNARRQ